MTKKITTTSKPEALTLARQCHGAIRDFLNQESTHTDILTFVREKTGDSNELRLMKEMLKSCNPILNDDIHKKYKIAKSTVSKIAKDLDKYLRLFSATIKPLKAARKTICIPRQDGGNNIGYHFACFDDKTKKYLDGSATSRLFKILWDDFVKDRLYKKLKKEATAELSKKLEGRNDYQELGLEIGSVPDRSQQEYHTDSMPYNRAYDHNRTWASFNIKSFFELRAVYIISVDAGRGKTTFLRHLQFEFLQKTKFLPVFLEASTIEEWKLKDRNDFAVKLAKHYGLKLPENRVVDFIANAFEERMIFLIDGLDQIKSGGSEYEHMVVDIICRIMGNSVIVASRPSAVVNLEEENQYTFIRLMPLNQKSQIVYFGNIYDRAKELSRYSPDLIAVPMLAYMVRTLIEGGEDKDIDSRTKLYQKFIEHILMKYKHGKTKLSPGLRTQIRMTLGKIAYLALTEKETHIQKIPLSFCYEKNLLSPNLTENDSESLTKSGLVNTVVEQSGFTSKDFLYFTHQSFQEYLAAEYISTNDSLIDHLLAEKWNPKWKETIKFLTGLRGQEIIERILEERDNVIYSKLFLAAEIFLETNVTSKLKCILLKKAEILFEDPVFKEDIQTYLLFINIDSEKITEKLITGLNNRCPNSCLRAIMIIRELKEKVDLSVVNKIVDLLADQDISIRRAAHLALIKLKDQLNDDVVNKIVEMLGNKNAAIRRSSLYALAELYDKNDSAVVNKIVNLIEDEDISVRRGAVSALHKIKCDTDVTILNRIVQLLENQDPCIRFYAVLAIRKLKEKIDLSVENKIIELFEDKSAIVRGCAVSSLLEYDEDVATINVLYKIVDMLRDESSIVRNSAVSALDKFNHKVDINITQVD